MAGAFTALGCADAHPPLLYLVDQLEPAWTVDAEQPRLGHRAATRCQARHGPVRPGCADGPAHPRRHLRHPQLQRRRQVPQRRDPHHLDSRRPQGGRLGPGPRLARRGAHRRPVVGAAVPTERAGRADRGASLRARPAAPQGRDPIPQRMPERGRRARRARHHGGGRARGHRALLPLEAPGTRQGVPGQPSLLAGTVRDVREQWILRHARDDRDPVRGAQGGAAPGLSRLHRQPDPAGDDRRAVRGGFPRSVAGRRRRLLGRQPGTAGGGGG